jgi:threonine synthase
MRYISTRGNGRTVTSAEAIIQGLAPGGGLFVPESVPAVDIKSLSGASYHETARRILASLLSDFTEEEIGLCIRKAYNPRTFDVPDVVDLAELDPHRFLLELWHGPTAAFKDVALQIMPHFLAAAKTKTGDAFHTLILVATSGDTGKAALEGFKDVPGISIAVFYPHEGISRIQELQMTTTDGRNTYVAAVRGNFDDCQTGVKNLFGDSALAESLAANAIRFSSANSINWGRLCPQIVYYIRAYNALVERGVICRGGGIDVCVPTGNFGNILAAFYARKMGLPVRRLVCASNRNNILTDFIRTGVYDTNRAFHKTSSPSMDILISSNLERFLFEITNHDADRIKGWFADLKRTGRFEADDSVRKAVSSLMIPGWADEPAVFETIARVFRKTGRVLDTHTAVAVAVSEAAGNPNSIPILIASTANPYKFSVDVLAAINGERPADEFEAVKRLHEISGLPVHGAVGDILEKPVVHDRVLDVESMRGFVTDIAENIRALH